LNGLRGRFQVVIYDPREVSWCRLYGKPHCTQDGHMVGQTCRSSLFKYRGADKSLARPGRKQATATEEFDVHISYL